MRFSNRYLLMAQHAYVAGLEVEPLCFAAQQAVEMSLKALLIASGARAPYTHKIAYLLDALDDVGVVLPSHLSRVRGMTIFAVTTRYPSELPDLKEDVYLQTLQDATEIVNWAQIELNRILNAELDA